MRRASLAVVMLVGALVAGSRGVRADVPPAVEHAPLYVIVPFAEPGDTDPVLAASTQQLSADLADRRVRSTLGIPTDTVEAVANADHICAKYDAAGILISDMRFGQTKTFNVASTAVGFVPYVGGVIAGAGVLDRIPITAQYKLYLIDCRGKVAWRTMTTASKIHKGNNLPAGLTEISFDAIAQAANAFASRRIQSHEPVSPPTPEPPPLPTVEATPTP